MMENLIKTNVAAAVKNLYNAEIEQNTVKIEPTNPDFKGDFTILAFPFLRFSKKNPEETANEIGNYMALNLPEYESHNVVKGFLNIEIKQSVWIQAFNGFQTKFTSENTTKMMVEYSSPNTNKPLHLGHIRNILLGASVSKIAKICGNEVIEANLVNDRGIHICKSMLAWQQFGNNETPEIAAIKGDHLVGKYYVKFNSEYKKQIKELEETGETTEFAEKNAPMLLQAQTMLQKWEQNDPATIELWQTMNAWVYDGFADTYKKLGIHFDHTYYESDTYLLGKDIVSEGLEKGVFYKKEDGSIWVDLTSDGLDEKLVLRGDGTSVYITQDIGTALLKFNDFNCSKSIYVVGNEQDYHFKVLFLILQKMGFDWAKNCYHLSYGMVDLPSGKMKSREGTVVDADDLIAEMINAAKEKTEELGKTEGMSETEKENLYKILGLGALKFFMLKVDPQKRMLFNPEESIDFQGDTGPFVQYTNTRILSMLRVAKADDLLTDFVLSEIHDSEKNLIKTLLNYQTEVEKAAQTYSPAVIVHYVLDVAKAFNRVYNDVSFLREPDNDKRQFRLHIAQKTNEVIQSCLTMLGIQCPERM